MITAMVGQIFDIDLKSTPTTGFRWHPAELPHGVELVDSGFTPTPGGQPGDGGTQHFRLRATIPGHYLIEFQLGRAWDGEAIDKQIVEVRIT